METINEAWAGILTYLHRLPDISEVGFDTWLCCIEPLNIDEGELVVQVQTQFQKKMVTEHYAARIAEACENVLGVPLKVRIVSEDDAEEADPYNYPGDPTGGYGPIREYGDEEKAYLYSFDNFIVGSSNKFAHAAALAVASKPATDCNPLVIYGGSGLGKTHLLYAICNESVRRHPDTRFLYTKGETLTNDMIEALRTNTMNEFRAKYRSVDILLVDDIQFIAGKEATQEEFFHTFDALYQAHKQIVLVSDRPPKEIATLEDRLRSRFESGVMADIQPPDFETRLAIVKRKAKLLDFEISENIAEYLANQLKGNVRQLEGAVKSMMAQCMLTGDSPNLFCAQNAIRDIKSDNQPAPITVDKVVSEVARTMNVPADDILSKKRAAPISQARQVAIYVTRTVTALSMEEIGGFFGGRDHSTVFYALETVEKRKETDPVFKGLISDIVKNLQSN